jgi:hypothetical protein
MSRKEKKKKKRVFGKIVLLLVLAGIVYIGFKYFKDDIVKPIRGYLPDFLTKNLGTPTPTPIDLKGITIRCTGGEWDKLDSDEEVYKTARETVERKYNVVLKKVDVLDNNEELAYMSVVDILKNSVEEGDPATDIVNLGSGQLYAAYFGDLLPDVTDYASKMNVGSVYKEAGTWKGKIYGISYDNVRNNMLIVYDRQYIEKLGLEQPYNLFIEGKWNYDDFEAYLRKMKAKLPEGVYPIGMDPYEWLSMAAGANGTVLFDNNGNINLKDEAVVEAVEFYQKLEAEQLAYPMTASFDEYGDIDFLDCVSGIEAEEIVLKTSFFAALPENKEKYGIVFWPWGSKVTCEDYYLTLSDNYKIATTNWSIDAPVKASCEKLGVDPAILTALIYDYQAICQKDTVDMMHRVWSSEKTGRAMDGTEVSKVFDSTTVNLLYEWGSERFDPDFSFKGQCFRYAGYETLCGYENAGECLAKWYEEGLTETENPFLSY